MRRYTLDVGGNGFVVDVQELDVGLFEVVVGGESYQVSLSGEESLTAAAPAVAARPVVTAAPVAAARPAAPAAAPAAAPKKTVKGGAGTQTAPMPGVIIEVKVKAGDKVERGTPIVVLDAMKMHNVIGANRAGTIAEVYVSEGQSVNHGDALVKFVEG